MLLDFDLAFVVFAGQLSRFFLTDDASHKFSHIQASGAFDADRAHDNFAGGADFDFEFFFGHFFDLNMRFTTTTRTTLRSIDSDHQLRTRKRTTRSSVTSSPTTAMFFSLSSVTIRL
jgi:hypothetical protein